MATDYNATLEQREITLRIALHGIVYSRDGRNEQIYKEIQMKMGGPGTEPGTPTSL